MSETANVDISPEDAGKRLDCQAGKYVALALSDSGCGIPPEVKARIFDPFFTTKETGKGTGLGLATVFGIVKQSNGLIDVSSTVGVGTKFEILFPAVRENASPTDRRDGALAKGNETVLLVEDESNDT